VPDIERPTWTGPCPDLLHPQAKMSIDAHALGPQLLFAFAGGDASERIRGILADVDHTATRWDPAVFSKHLFIDTWVDHLCGLPLEGRPLEADPSTLRALITRPPSDAAERTFRQDVLKEVANSPTVRDELLEIYRELRRLRVFLLRAPPDGAGESTRRRIQILGVLRAIFERVGASFHGCTSGLQRLRELAIEHTGRESFRRLVDLLDHDRHRATVDLQIRLGGDGRVRTLVVAKIHEDPKNRFYRTPAQRLWAKIGLLLRGYRFSDAELVDRWIDSVYDEIAQIIPGFLQLIGHIELYLVALAFREEARAKGLEVSLPEIEEGPTKLDGLFNPLLLAQGTRPVPCDLVRRGPGSTTVITGPNSGGKTRLLQSIGLAQLLGQGGLFVPARRAKLRIAPYLFCSLVQEESFDQSEGRLGTELLRIRRMFESAPPGSLIIIDELCSGTNPSEGEEIFMLVIQLLRELEPETFVTTHFLDFAHRLEARSDELKLSFLRVELDEAQHPTFAFAPGVAPTSLAGRAASRLGVTRDELSALVRKHKA